MYVCNRPLRTISPSTETRCSTDGAAKKVVGYMPGKFPVSPVTAKGTNAEKKKVITNINRTDSRVRSIVAVRGRVAHIKRPYERDEPGMNDVVVGVLRRGRRPRSSVLENVLPA